MKRIAIIMAALAILVTGCSKGQKFTLKGDLDSANFNPAADTLTLQSDGFSSIRAIPVRKGAFSFTGKVEKPMLATLKAPGEKDGRLVSRLVVLEKGTITFDHGLPRGTPLNDAFFELNRQIREVMQENRDHPQVIPDATFKLLSAYLSDHPDDPSAVIAIVTARHFTRPDKMSELIAMTSKSIQKDSHVQQLLLMSRRRGLKPLN